MTHVLVRQASTLEAVSAFFLVVGNYTKKGYVCFSFSMDWITSLLKIGKQMFRPSNEILVAEEDACVVGTISYMVDNGNLPADKLFHEKLVALRTSEKKWMYIGSFATTPSKHCKRVALLMIREVERRAVLLGVTSAMCIVNPAHVGFYQKYGFRFAGKAESMTGLSGEAEAILLVKDDILSRAFCK